MTASVARGLLVTGTDTGVGKTFASVALLHALRGRGRRAVGMKPVAAGCEVTPEGLRNEDALALQAASAPRPAYPDVNPWALPAATAPTLAARAAGVEVAMDRVLPAYARLAAGADVVVVEGAGGWMSPLGERLEHADLARALDLSVVLVVGLRLGCLSHARLSARAIQADGLPFVGWIGSTLEAGFAAGYLQLLEEALPVPRLGVLPHGPFMDPAAAAGFLGLPGGW